MAANTGFRGSDALDVGNKYITKAAMIDLYPNLLPAMELPQLWTWGRNVAGQLGDGTTTSRSSPGTVAGGGTTWKQATCGQYSTAVIKTDGTLWTWGNDLYGQLGDGTTTSRSSPGTVAGGGTTWLKVATWIYNIAAIKTDGTLWTWGSNFYGELGTNSTTDRSSPGTVAGGGTTWANISLGLGFIAAIKTDGTLWTWGANSYGSLGDGTATNHSSPTTTIGGGTTWAQVSCGSYQTAAIKTDGTLWTWGKNDYGQLGDGTTTSRRSPITTSGGGTTWSKVACGYDYIAAIKTDGTLWTWGSDSYGQLGDGTTTSRSSPGTVAGGGTNWSQVTCGLYNTAAIKTDGTLWTWGYNNWGQLGDGTTNSRSSPGTTILGGTNWKQIAGGSGQMVAISEQGNW